MTPSFEITIQRCLEFDVFPVIAELSRPGEALPQRTEGRLTLSAADLEDLATKTRPIDYGSVLGGLLFQGEVLRAFDRAVSTANGRMNVLLAIEAPELRRLHWEWLCIPIDGSFRPIAQDQRFPFCLFQPSQVDRRFPPFGRRDLRMLIIVASPHGLEKYNLDPFDESRALESVSGAVSGAISYDVLSCNEDLSHRVGPASLSKLCERLTEKRYTLLHIIAHGRYARDGETILYLGNDQGDVQPISAKDLLGRLALLNTLPHFVFLAVCESARPEAEAALGGLGQRLVRELGTPAVLAMTRKVSHFLAYELARRLYPQLVEHGYVERALVEACAGLIGQADVSVPALYSRLGGRPLWSDDLAGRELTPIEIEYGLDRVLTLFADRAPVLIPGLLPLINKLRATLGLAPQPSTNLAGTERHVQPGGGKFRSTMRVMSAGTSGVFDRHPKDKLRRDAGLTDLTTLSVESRQEFQRAMSELETLCQQVLELSFSAVALDKKVPVYLSQCPFPGMRAFAEDDQRYFFGREALVESLLRRIKAHPFLAVLGASGSGKSSVVRAGLLPRLRKEIAGLLSVTVIPGSDPYSQLEAALEKAGVTEPGRAEPGTFVLFVDQFEEVFTLCPREKRSLFLQRLLMLLPANRIVLTMRADFWGECAEYTELRRLMQEHQELVAPMTPHELRSAIEQQARATGLRFEPTLCAKIVEQVQSEPGAMPLLQHALLKLWERRHGSWLSTSEYEAIGGVQRAIAETADSIYNGLLEEDRARMRAIFVRLTHVDENAAQGEARRDTRQRVGKLDLIPAGTDSSLYLALIAHLADARLLVTSVSPSTQQEEVEVVHESLIRNWPRLQTWLEEQRDSLTLREALSKAARDWKKRRKDRQWLLHSGSRLRECEELHTRFPGLYNQLEQEYLTACRAQTNRARLAWLAVLLGFGASGIGITGLVLLQRQARHHQGNQLVEATLAAEWAQSRQAGTLAMLLAHESGTRLRALDQGVLAVAPFFKQQVHPPGAALGGLHDGLSVAAYVAPLIPAHTGAVTTVAASSNGMLLASAGTDKQIRLFDTQRGQLYRSISTSPAVCHMLIFSPLGNRLYAALSDGTVHSYDPNSGRLVRVLSKARSEVLSLALTADGSVLATGAADGSIRLLDSSTGKQRQLLVGHQHGVRALAFSVHADQLVSGGEDRTLRIWNLSSRRPKALVIRAHHGAVNAVLVIPQRAEVISGGADQQLSRWSLLDGKPLGPSLSLSAPITALALHGNDRVAVGDSEGTTLLFRMGVRTPMWSLKDEALDKPAAALHGIAFLSEQTRLVTAASDGLLRVWNLPRSAPFDYLPDHAAAITALAWSPDGRYGLTAAADRSLRISKITSGRIVRELRGLDSPVIVAEFAPAGEVTAITRNGSLLRYQIDRDVAVWKRSMTTQRVVAAHMDSGAQRVLLASGSRVSVFALPSGDRLGELQAPQIVHAVALSSDGKLAAVSSADERIRIYDLDRLALQRTLDVTGSQVMLLRFSADGNRLLSGGARQRARVWDLQSGQHLDLPSNHSYKQVSLEFSRDGQRVMVGRTHGILTIHDAKTGAPIFFLRTRHGLLRTAMLSPDSQRVLTGGNDGAVHLFLIDSVQLWKQGCETLALATRSEDDDPSVFDQARTVCEAETSKSAQTLGAKKPARN